MKNIKVSISLYNRVEKVIDYYNKNNLYKINIEEISSNVWIKIPYENYLEYIFNLENTKIAYFLDYLLKISDDIAKNDIKAWINLDNNFYYIEERRWNIPSIAKLSMSLWTSSIEKNLICEWKHIWNIFYISNTEKNEEKIKEKNIYIKELESDKVTLYNWNSYKITQTFYKILNKFKSSTINEINILTSKIAINEGALNKTILRLQNKLNKELKINKVRNEKLWYLSK